MRLIGPGDSGGTLLRQTLKNRSSAETKRPHGAFSTLLSLPRKIPFFGRRLVRTGLEDRPVVVTMIAVGMVRPSFHEIINVVAMGHGFVPEGQ
jgi:hypothetical protein